VPALHRAFALAQVDDVAVRIGQHLNLHVPRIGEGLLQEQLARAERALGLGTGPGNEPRQLAPGGGQPQAAPAAARGCFHHHRKADALGLVDQSSLGLVAAPVARQRRHVGLRHAPLGLRLVAHGRDRVGRRTDEHEARLGTGPREIGVLGEEAVARMRRVRADPPGCGEDRAGVEIAHARLGRADARRDIGLAHMERVGVGLRIDGRRAIAHRPGRAHHPAGDLPAVGD
jgi:hypothetical protein